MNRQITTFMLGDTRLGVDILLVKEVYRQMSVTPVPDSPDHLRGLMNLRGRVVTVIDLNVCLNRPAAEDIDTHRLLVLKTDEDIKKYKAAGLIQDVALGEDIVGFLIDRMDDVIDIDASDIVPAPPNLEDVERDLMEGVIKLDRELIIVLDVHALLKLILDACEAGGA